MARTTTAVSVRGNKAYTGKLNILAAQQRIAVADLVRLAIDTVYGVKLDEISDILLAQDGKQNIQVDTEIKIEGTA